MRNTIMTPEAISEIEILIPDHKEALMRYGAQMYREGIIKGAVWACVGLVCGISISAFADWLIYIKKNNKTES